jgi:hypothetical protein
MQSSRRDCGDPRAADALQISGTPTFVMQDELLRAISAAGPDVQALVEDKRG